AADDGEGAVGRRAGVGQADQRRDARDVVVHVVADRLGVTDGALVRLDEGLEVTGRSEAEAERSEPEPSGLLEGGRAAAGDPDRRGGVRVGVGEGGGLGPRGEETAVGGAVLPPPAPRPREGPVVHWPPPPAAPG